MGNSGTVETKSLVRNQKTKNGETDTVETGFAPLKKCFKKIIVQLKNRPNRSTVREEDRIKPARHLK